MNADVIRNAPFTSTDTDSVDATDDPYIYIRSIRIGSVNESAEPATVRFVSIRSEGSASKFLSFKIQARMIKTVMSRISTHLFVSYP